MMNNNSMMMDGSMMSNMCFLMFGGLLLLVISAGITVYIVTRKLMRQSKTEDQPLMILKEHYANGEISDEEYLHKASMLKNQY
ncbi:SHOCT domain-containing protein [Paenibacillus enshidis]|uniref:SHOCT domain-containing protein n=1 Tax=Paenibacillus enshidis TaxID=1458439 RepID=A0ABV5AW93_9BACL